MIDLSNDALMDMQSIGQKGLDSVIRRMDDWQRKVISDLVIDLSINHIYPVACIMCDLGYGFTDILFITYS